VLNCVTTHKLHPNHGSHAFDSFLAVGIASVQLLILDWFLSFGLQVAHFVKIFPGVAHGWSVRYSHDDAAAVASAEEAMVDTIDWFNKNLK